MTGLTIGDKVFLTHVPGQHGVIIADGIISAETGEPLLNVKLDNGETLWFNQWELRLDKTGWQCGKCGWVHHPDHPCACPPDTECDCCVIETVTITTRCEDAPCCGCCDLGSAVMPG